MALYKIVKPWCYDAGYEAGKIISLASLHPSLEAHVILVSETDEVEVANVAMEVATPEETPKRRA